MKWVTEFSEAVREQSCVLVTLCQLSGSAPRESGSRMVVTRDGICGSVGGGNLEFKATGIARALLAGCTTGHQQQEAYGLGPALNQCCGGAVSLLYEVYGPGIPDWMDALLAAQEHDGFAVLASRVDGAASCKQVISPDTTTDNSLPAEVAGAARELIRQWQSSGTKECMITVETRGGTWWLESLADDMQHVMLFGAGHVGQAVAQFLSFLPFRVTWIDSREGLFPPDLPAAFELVHCGDPAAEVASAETDCIFVVMTHSHQMDEDVCLQVLKRGDSAWLGLIGSETKRRRFVYRLGKRGIEPDQLEQLVCPIGLSSIGGKEPETIALSLAAQLMTLRKRPLWIAV